MALGGALLVAIIFALPAGAIASSTPEQLTNLAVAEPFDGSNASLERFETGWSTLGWAGGNTPKGSDTSEGWRAVDAYAFALNGAYYDPSLADTGAGVAAAATMAANPGITERYFSLWLDMPSPGGAKAGYELRFTETASNTYEVELSKWQSGSQTVLATKPSYSFENGDSFAIVDRGATVSAWTDTGSGFESLLSAEDSDFAEGTAGVEAKGNITRLTDFKAGALSSQGAPDTTISSGPTGVVVPNVSFSFEASESGATFECALDGASFGECASPKPYAELAEGVHTFKVRAVGSGGVDATPAERSFMVVEAGQATVKTPIRDDFVRSEVPLATGEWSKTAWASEIGGAWLGYYHGYGSSGGLAGAYWNPTTLSDGEEAVLVSSAVGTGSTPAGQYMSLWLDMPDPGSARTGYEARFTGVDGTATNYKVELSRWDSGTRTVLATVSGFPLPVNSTMTLSETSGGDLTLWTGTSSLSPALSAQDSTYTSGYAGVEMNGGAGTVYNFRAGRIDLVPPDTTIDSGPSGTIQSEEATFTFTSTEPGSSFDCKLDAGEYGACDSPKVYSSLAAGGHEFRVRAVDDVGNVDESPAERTFDVVRPPIVETSAATDVTATEATLRASVNPENAATTYQFEYGATAAYGSKIPLTAKAIGSGSQDVEVSELLAGLTEGATYHYRVVAENDAGVSYGEDEIFDTPMMPEAETEGTTAVDANEAILEGVIDPNGGDTSYKFEYGTTTAYGEESPGGWEEIGSGTGNAEPEAAIAFLEPETTYHYRVAATNESGTDHGEDQTFTTAPREVSPEQEAEEREEETHFTAKFTGNILPTNFINMMWSGVLPQTADPSHLEAIQRSGAKMLRIAVGPNPAGVMEWSYYDQIFERAARRGITILPQVGGDIPQNQEQETHFLELLHQIIDHYGPGGVMENGNPVPNPPTWWEFGNEENYSCCGSVDPEGFGKLLEGASGVMHEAADGELRIVLGGLLSVGAPTSDERQHKRTPAEFLNQMGPYGRDDYDAVGLHPYAFKANYGGPPLGPNQVKEVRDKVRGNIKEARHALDCLNRDGSGHCLGSSKDLWLNELGWPTQTWDPEHHPAVSLTVQRELVESTFEMIQANWQNFGIRNVFYYNIQDITSHPYNVNTNSWDYRSGLRGAAGNYRPAWYGFQEETGVSKWPVPAGTKTGGTKTRSHRATMSAEIDPKGSPTIVWYKYGPTTSYGSFTGARSAGFEEGEKHVESEEVTGLAENQTYHYRAVSENENGERAEGEDRTFVPSPNTSVYIEDPVQKLNGNPGWVTVKGGVTWNEGTVYGKYVNVDFSKWENGQWVYKSTYEPHPVVNGGVYEARYWPVGTGKWRVKVVFPEQESLDESESGYHEFEIHDGYQIVNKATGKCLDIAFESPDNAALGWLWDCHSPATNGQTFTVKPVNTGTWPDHFQIIARNSDKCVDVKNDSTAAGEQLQQWACADPIPSVQEWRRYGSSNGWNFTIQHTGQCMDDWESGAGNGNKIDQWPCNETNAQHWELRSVDAPPVTTHVNPNNPEVLQGEPGLVTFGGQIDLSGYPTGGATVHVNLAKDIGGVYQYQEGESFNLEVNSSGHFERDYWGVGVGQWRAHVVFDGNTTLGASDGGYQYFTVHRGYHLVNQTSGKCLSANEGRPDNGTKILQWDCSGNPQPGDGQLVTWYPSARWPYFQIRFNEPGGNNAGQCLTVPGESYTEGVQLIEWDCLGEYAGNNGQLWKGDGGEFIHFSVLHSGQCIDDWTSGLNNGNKIDQWPCNGTGAQGWRFLPVG
ncbi:MAG TPA: RICIN domain-containing protein [Solirubrobacterales bacterium]|nr:RICIN domain-containing protein [Solirubrobacterales bacterium]